MRQFTLTQANTARTTYRWTTCSYSLDAIIEMFTDGNRVRVDKTKDGPCVVAGELVGSQRLASAVRHLDFLIYDIDDGQTYDEVKELMLASGYYFMMTTTYNHKSTQTFFLLDKILKHCAQSKIDTKGKPPHLIPGVMKSFLASLKKADRFKNSSWEEDRVHTPEGQCVVLNHDPVDKIRVIMPLKHPVVMMDLGVGKDALAEWKRFYHTVGKEIGLNYDHACEDASRLHYLPSCPPEKVKDYRAESFFCDSRRFIAYADTAVLSADELGLDIAENHHASGKTVVNAHGKHIYVTSMGDKFDLDDWCKRYMQHGGEALYEVLREVDAEFIRGGETPAKWEEGFRQIQCPFEDFHTKPGGTGTFLKLPDEDNGWTMIRCLHDHCKDNTTEAFITQMMNERWLEPKHLLIVQKISAMIKNGHDVDVARMVYSEMFAQDELVLPELDVVDADMTTDRNDLLKAIEVAVETTKDWPSEVFEYLERTATRSAYETFWTGVAERHAIERNTVNEVLCIASSDLTLTVIRDYYRSHIKRLNISIADLENTVCAVRHNLQPYEALFEPIFTSGLKNQILVQRLTYIGDKYGLTPSEMRDAYSKFAADKDAIEEAPIRERAAQLDKKYAKLLEGGVVSYIDLEAYEETGELLILKKDGIRDIHSNEKYEIRYSEKSKPLQISAVNFWFDKAQSPQIFYGKTFDPSQIGSDGMSKFNTFQGLKAIEPIPGDISYFLEHIKKVWCRGNQEHLNWVMTWFAQIYQQPEYRYPSAIMIVGSHGSGKSFPLEEGFKPIFDPYTFMSSSTAHLTGDFNAHLGDKLLFIGEEALFRGDLAGMNTLKSLISSSEFGMTKKGVDTQKSKMFCRMCFLSNHRDGLHLEKGDRRFFVLESSDDFRQDIPYYDDMSYKLRYKGGLQALAYVLKTWNPAAYGLTWNDLRKPPMTDIKRFQIEQSLAAPDYFWLDLIANGMVSHLPADSDLPVFVWGLESDAYVALTDISALFDWYMLKNGNKRHEKTKFKDSFATMIGTPIDKATTVHAPNPNALRQAYIHLPVRRAMIERNRDYMSKTQYEMSLGNTSDSIDVRSATG